MSTIVADSRVTHEETPTLSHDDMTKVGILFPGCIYGLAGCLAAYDFLNDFQRSGSVLGHEPAEDWEYFKKYAAAYRSADKFKVILSERTTGTPKLHLYDSSLQTLAPCGEFVTAGSGKHLFDNAIREWIDARLDAVEERLISQYGHTLLFPNFICLPLIEIVQGEDASSFRSQDIGIGGVFHYVVQDGTSESFQVPSVYLVLSRDNSKERRVAVTPFRVCGTEFGITIQGPPPFDAQPSLHLDTSKVWRVRNPAEIRMLIDQVIAHMNTLPRYSFLGICFAEKKYRGTLIVDTTFSGEYSFDGKTIGDELWRKVEEIYTTVDAAESAQNLTS